MDCGGEFVAGFGFYCCVGDGWGDYANREAGVSSVCGGQEGFARGVGPLVGARLYSSSTLDWSTKGEGPRRSEGPGG